MSKVEDMLNNKKLEMDKIEVPEELEGRLRGALYKVQPKKSTKNKAILKVASLIIAITLIGYNIDTLAFYGKKIMGFDEVMTDTLKELNELGKGQSIDKSYIFKNGVKVIVDGIMMDDNQLLMFYKILDPRGNIDDPNLINTDPYIEGIIGRYNMRSGEGKSNEPGTEIKWKTEFEKPYFFEKTLKWSFWLTEDNNKEVGEIKFKIDRSKAMGHILKKSLNKSIKIDQGEITFKSIVASPTVTYIEGSLQNIVELARDEVKGEGFRPSSLDIRLMANGKEVQRQGSGMSTNMNGITFDNRFDALPKKIESLQIKVVSLQTDNKVNEQVKLNKGDESKKLEILGQQIEINKVYESEGKTYVTITTEEDVLLSNVHMVMDGENVGLKNTTPASHDKKADGTILYTRTLCFEEIGKELVMEIKGIRYRKVYNELVDVPID